MRLIGCSSFGQGLLTGKYTPQNPPPGVRRWIYRREKLARVQSLVQLMGETGKGYGGRTPVQVAINWPIAKGVLPIPGAKNAEQAEEHVGGAGWRLSEEDVARLDAASAGRW